MGGPLRKASHRVFLACAAMAAIALLAPAARAEKALTTDLFERRVPLASGGSFSLVNVNGSVQVEAWERDTVEIRAVKTARGSQRDAARVQIHVESTPNAVSVRTEYPQDDGVEVTVDFRIRVPYRALLSRVETVNGAVRVRGVEGAGSLRSVNGNVEVFDAAGRFNARTTNGNIRIELRQLPAGPPVAIETMNGSVVLALPPDANAELDVRSLNGDFRSDLPLLQKGSIGPREYHGRLGSGGGEVRVRTVNGGIRVVEARPTV